MAAKVGQMAIAFLRWPAADGGGIGARRRKLAATKAPALNVLRQTIKHVADVFQVSPRAAGTHR